jgi:hypothetical protein
MNWCRQIVLLAAWPLSALLILATMAASRAIIKARNEGDEPAAGQTRCS